MLAPNAALREAVTAPAGAAGATVPMRIIAFALDQPVIERILDHIGEPTRPPAALPACSPPQLAFGFDQMPATDDWPEMDQTAGQRADDRE